MECKKTQIIQLQSHTAEPCDSYMVLGEVAGVHIKNDMLKGSVYSTLAADPILRAGGAVDYFTIDEAQKFEMLRPKLD
jgi:flavin reductase (DIM6/NTAB) family NADH-FMN oxidoreductase RutF